jgi:6-phosphogluconolactonase
MGLDGHTASLFPETEVLEEGLDPDSDRSILVVQPIDAPHTRLTLTAARLLKTRNLFLHIEGQAKREVFKVAAQQTVVGMPIGFFAQQTQIPMQVYWSP